jgi:uncharacterized protein YkwD
MWFARKISIVFSILLGTGTLAAPAAARPTAAEASVIQAVNQVRAQHGLRRLAVDVRLERAARAHSRRMIRSGSFAHGNVQRRLAAVGVRGRIYGENLAWGVGSSAHAAAVVRMWLASPPHRANLLRPGFRRIGLGRAVGTFAGYGGAAVVTANFAG